MKTFILAIALFLTASSTYAAVEYVVPDIDHADLVKAIADKKVVLLDVNGSESFAKGHIPGAIDYAVAKDKLADKLPSDKGALIVAYCGGPQCAAYKQAAAAAVALGYTNVKHLKEGISGWTDSGAKVESSAGAKASSEKPASGAKQD